MLYDLAAGILLPVCRLLFHLTFHGLEQVPQSGKVILCSNHKSVFDPIFLACAVKKSTGRRIRFMAKSELFDEHGNLVAALLRHLGAFPVRRNSGDSGSVKIALSVLRAEGMVGIFPQGGCVPDNTPFRPKAGVAMIAQLARAPVLPACIYCDGEPRPFRRVSVRFGPVISENTFESEEKKRDILKKSSEKVAKSINLLLEEGY